MDSIAYKNRCEDIKLIQFIASYYFMHAISGVIHLVIGDGQLYELWKVLFWTVLCVLSARSIQSVVKRSGILFFIIEAIFVSMFLVSLYMYRNIEYDAWKDIVLPYIAIYVPLGISAYCIYDKKLFFEYFYKLAFPTQFALIISSISLGMSSDAGYSMTNGYLLIIPMMFMCGHYIITRNKLDIIFVVVDLVVIFVFCSRGPILCFAVFMLLNLFFSKKITLNKKVIIAGTLIVMGVLGIVFFEQILNIILSLLEMLGFRSRTLELILRGVATQDSGRIKILEAYWQLVQEKPYLGWGAIGGRKYSSYPHNLYMDLLLSFGIPIGCVLSGVITLIIIRGLFQKEIYTQMLAFIFIARVMGLMLSSSIFQSAEFLVCIALCLSGRLYVKEGGGSLLHMVYCKNKRVRLTSSS